MPVARTSPSPTRQDNQSILSYYQSSLADQPYVRDDQETEQLDELNSNGVIDSSPLPPPANGTHSLKSNDLDSIAKHRRKHMIESGAHNRKAAIVPVEVGTLKEQWQSASGVISSSTLPLSSRGLVVEAQLASSALVAPLDTSRVPLHDIPFSSLTSSLPSIVSPTTPSVVRSPSSSSSQAEYARKARTTTSHTKSSSRDIGIVGTRREPSREFAKVSQDILSDLKPPIFQIPAARSPSPHIFVSTDTSNSNSSAHHIPSNVSHAPPSAMAASVEPMHSVSPVMNRLTEYTQPRSAPSIIASSSRHQGISTPERDQVSPSSASPMSTAPSSYLHYQPGIHSKAGPLPPPPRAMFDIDFSAPPPPRPPRLRSPSPMTAKRGPAESTTSTSVTVRLASKTSVTSIHHQIQLNSVPPSNNESSSSESEGSIYSPE